MLLAFLPLPVKSQESYFCEHFVTAMVYDVPSSSLAIVGSHEVLDFEQIEKDLAEKLSEDDIQNILLHADYRCRQ